VPEISPRQAVLAPLAADGEGFGFRSVTIQRSSSAALDRVKVAMTSKKS